MKHTRFQLDTLVYDLIKNMDVSIAKQFLLKNYRKTSFNRLTLEELEHFFKSFSKPEQHSPSSESHHQTSTPTSPQSDTPDHK